MSLVRNSLTIGGLTLVSRVLGFVRDLLMARFIGAGLASDAFLIAWRLPNLFRSLFAEGAFSAAFVPMFNKSEARKAFAEQVLAVLAPILLIFTALMMIAAGPIVWAMTGGFPGDSGEKFALATELTRITFPYLLLISLCAMVGGILNSLDRFWVNAAAPVLLNLCLIAALLFFRGETALDTAYSQALAVTLSGLLQLAWMVWALRRAKFSLRLRLPRLTPEVKHMLWLIWPAAIGAGATQINLLVSTSLAARFLSEGAVSWLYYADRLNQLPLGLIGIGVGTALLPGLSRLIGAHELAAANHLQNRAIELVLLLTLPAAAAFVVSAGPLIAGTLQHGAFSASDTAATAAALAIFALGLPAYVLIKILTPGFHARGDTRTPVRIALLAIAANLIGNIALIWSLGHIGIALATALSAWLNVILLWLMLVRRGQFSIDAQLARRLPRLLLAALLMAASLWLLNPLLLPALSGGLLARITGLTLLIGIGGAVYFGGALLFGAFALNDLRMLVRRKG
jgi:putative peptidoglycan lipid II flippase